MSKYLLTSRHAMHEDIFHVKIVNDLHERCKREISEQDLKNREIINIACTIHSCLIFQKLSFK